MVRSYTSSIALVAVVSLIALILQGTQQVQAFTVLLPSGLAITPTSSSSSSPSSSSSLAANRYINKHTALSTATYSLYGSSSSSSARLTAGHKRSLPVMEMSATAASAASASASSSTVQGVTQLGRVTVYHKETCPFCKKVFALLEGEYGLTVTKVNVLEGEDSEKKIKQMKTFSGRNTVPQVFFNSEHLGGNDDVQQLHTDGKLSALVEQLRETAPGAMKDSWYHPWY